MPNGNKTVMFEGKPYAFPSDATNEEIGTALTRHVASSQPGAMQTTKGGPVVNARSLTPPGEETFGSTFDKGMNEMALGGSSGVTGAPESTSPLKDMWKNISQHKPSAAEMLDPTGGALTNAVGMGKRMVGAGKEMGGAIGQPTADRGVVDSGQFLHGFGSLIGQFAQLGLFKESGEAVTDPIGRESVKNVMNQGSAKADFIGRQVERAGAAQNAVKTTLDSVHADGKQLMSGVSSKIDAAEPNGAFDKADVHGAVKDAMGVVKADQRVPAAISKVLEEGGTKPKGPIVGGKQMDLSKSEDMATYRDYKSRGVFTPEQAAQYEGSVGGKMSFEELHQVTSDIGRAIKTSKGPVEAGVKTAYAKLSEMLRSKVESTGKETGNTGLLDDWMQGKDKVKTFYDIAHRSPLEDTYFGGNHGKIMKPLISDDLGPQVQPLLEKISPYGLDMDKLKQTVDGYRYGKKMDSLNEPTRFTPIMAAISPKLAAAKIAATRFMRTNLMESHLYGKGLYPVPQIKPNKLYPSKQAAAAAALKGKGATP